MTDTPEYKECTQLLNFLSKDQLVEKMSKMCDILRNFIKYGSTKELKDVLQLLITHMIEIKEADYTVDRVENEQPQLEEQLDRAALKQVSAKELPRVWYRNEKNWNSFLFFLLRNC